MKVIHAPLQFPKGIEYKIYCSTEIPTETYEQTEARIYSYVKRKKKSLRKKISAFLRNIIRASGISALVRKAGLKNKFRSIAPKEVDEQELAATLRYVLCKFCPSSEFLGYQTRPGASVNKHKVILAQSNWPEILQQLLEHKWQKENIIIMPVPESDYWGYWQNLYFIKANKKGQPDFRKTIGGDEFIFNLQKNRVIKNDRLPLKFRTKKTISRRGLEQNTHVLPYPSFEIEKIAQNKRRIEKIIDKLSDKKSREIYKTVLFGAPEARWKHYIKNTVSNQQYFEYVKYTPGDNIINVGLDNGFEIPFLCAHLEGKGKIYNLDPFGFKFLSPYVNKTTKYFPQLIEENIGVVCDRSGIPAAKPAIGDFGNVPGVTIDDFVKENRLKKVDLIKMDIESMEELAVPHMLETVKKFRPQLAIAVYHKPEHLWELPELIMKNCKNYKFYFNIYSISFPEGIFYAIPNEKTS